MACEASDGKGAELGKKMLRNYRLYQKLKMSINRPIQAKCVASVTNCGLGLETAMAPTLNRGWQLFTNGKLFHITLRLVFHLNDCIFTKDLIQY